MRRNSKMTGILMAAAVMMAATGCSSKTAVTETTVATEAETTTTEAATTKEETTEEETAEEETTDEETASDAGAKGTDGVFTAASGKFMITPPSDWKLDGSSNDRYVTFLKENGESTDMLEVVCLTGEEAAGVIDDYPETGEQYMKEVGREGDGTELVNYEVSTSEDGSQTFKYAMKFKTPEDGVRYLAVSGVYTASTGELRSATATVMSEGLDDAAQKAVDSFTVK